MYNSLVHYCKDFHLYVFAFDDKCYYILKEMNLEHLTAISLYEFEDPELLEVKPTRTRGEYCWTCTSSTILYILKRYDVDSCTYLDSDLYFFSTPEILINEMSDNSVLITPHHYTKKYDQSNKTGIYCVQFVTFKNNEKGLKVLNWWRNVCIEWCYNRFEENRFGDQKYLDDWPERFDGVYVCENLGAGVAPWNMQQYTFVGEKEFVVGTEIATGNRFKVIFTHFHSFTFVSPFYFSPRPYYKRKSSVIRLLFNPYMKEIQRIRNQFPQIKNSEVYLSGFKKIKYLLEVFLRRGFKELYYIKLLHEQNGPDN
ncbi:MAG: glycosyl transferase [Tannerella sp.]|nr:glycosyl transferase [Tannerella sp.]